MLKELISLPKSKLKPRINLKGLGTMMFVTPILTKYTTRRGREAIVGRRSLSLHLRSRTSSAKPRKIIQQIDSRPAINMTNCAEQKVNVRSKTLLTRTETSNVHVYVLLYPKGRHTKGLVLPTSHLKSLHEGTGCRDLSQEQFT